MRFAHQIWISAGCSLLAAPLFAQDPNYFRLPQAKPSLGQLEIGHSYMLAPDVNFGGLGNIAVPTIYEEENGGARPSQGDLDPGRYDKFADGHVGQDYIVKTVDGFSYRERPKDGKTGYFGYKEDRQVDPSLENQDNLALHNFGSVASDASYKGDGSSGMGFDLNYKRFLSEKKGLGWTAGFNFSGFDSDFNDSVDAGLRGTKYLYELTGDDLAALPDNDAKDGKKPYNGDDIRDDKDKTFVSLNPDLISGMTPDQLDDYTHTVDGDIRFRSSMFSFRLGPTYNLDLTKRISLNFAAGVSSTYYSGTLDAIEFLNIEGLGQVGTTGLTKERNSDVLFGGYVETKAAYQLNERVNFYSGVQYQSSGNFNMAVDDYNVDVDLGSQMYVKTGFGVAF
ncbi:MAG: hypothetical protein Q7P63_08565 [Verrucomicrobiota bacterium JB022]|nr:hypothetical protein [Verrucomicrobiota bacterium JB022]